MVQFHSFVCGCLVFPVPFIEETFLSSLYVVGSFRSVLGLGYVGGGGSPIEKIMISEQSFSGL